MMKIVLNIFLIFILCACHSTSGDNHIDSTKADSVINTNKQPVKSITIDTIEINHQKFLQVSVDSSFNSLLSIQGDTIVKAADFYFKLNIIDIDEDGYQDLRIFIFSNTPNQCDNYLFSKQLNTFVRIEHCDLDIQKINGTSFYYSYNSAGCADMNWESSLSKIEHGALVDYGYIYGQGCESDPKEQQRIDIYKINPGKEDKTLIKTLPYQKHIYGNEDKWNFIEKYWKENFRLFK